MISRYQKNKWTGTLLLAITVTAAVAVVSLTGCNKMTDIESPSTISADAEPSATGTDDSGNTASPKPTDAANPATGTDGSGNTVSPKPTDTASPVTVDQSDSGTPTPSPKPADEKVYYGQWVIRKVLSYGSAGTYGSDDAEKLVGKSLSFSADEDSIFNDRPSASAVVIKNPKYQETLVSSSDFLANFRMSFEKIGISTDSVAVVDVAGSEGTAGCSLLVKDSNTIILVAGGTYFELVRT